MTDPTVPRVVHTDAAGNAKKVRLGQHTAIDVERVVAQQDRKCEAKTNCGVVINSGETYVNVIDRNNAARLIKGQFINTGLKMHVICANRLGYGWAMPMLGLDTFVPEVFPETATLKLLLSGETYMVTPEQFDRIMALDVKQLAEFEGLLEGKRAERKREEGFIQSLSLPSLNEATAKITAKISADLKRMTQALDGEVFVEFNHAAIAMRPSTHDSGGAFDFGKPVPPSNTP